MALLESIEEIEREKTKLFDSVICTKTIVPEIVPHKQHLITFCGQYKRAKRDKLMFFYELGTNRWFATLNNKFKKFSRLIKDFR